MQNLRYKLVFIMSVFITGTHALLGAINASEHYTYHTRIFLDNLGLRNSSAVPIRRMDRNDPHYRAAGYSTGTAIYLNEDLFARNSRTDGLNLFTCAHEAAHHVLGHAFKGNSLAIEQEADVTAARMLCRDGYRWVVEEQVTALRQMINAGQGDHTDGEHPTTQEEYVYLCNVLNNTQHAPNPNPDQARPKPDQARPKPNPDQARRPKPNRNRGKAGSRRNPVGRERNTNKGPERNPVREDNAHRDERNPYHEDNSYRERKPHRSGVEELKDLLRHFNNLSREQKLVIAGIVGMRFMGWI